MPKSIKSPSSLPQLHQLFLLHSSTNQISTLHHLILFITSSISILISLSYLQTSLAFSQLVRSYPSLGILSSPALSMLRMPPSLLSTLPSSPSLYSSSSPFSSSTPPLLHPAHLHLPFHLENNFEGQDKIVPEAEAFEKLKGSERERL